MNLKKRLSVFIVGAQFNYEYLMLGSLIGIILNIVLMKILLDFVFLENTKNFDFFLGLVAIFFLLSVVSFLKSIEIFHSSPDYIINSFLYCFYLKKVDLCIHYIERISNLELNTEQISYIFYFISRYSRRDLDYLELYEYLNPLLRVALEIEKKE